MTISVQQPLQLNLPSLSHSRKKASSTLNPKSIRPPKDSVHFGMKYYQMQGPTASTDANNPVFRNNCLVNSVKNLLVYYGYSEDIIENIVHEDLKAEILNPKYSRIDEPKSINAHTGEVDLNESYVRQYLSDPNEGLGMELKAYKIQQLALLEEAIDQRKPILVFGTAGAHTLAVDNVSADRRRHYLSGNHAYVVVPSSIPDEWLVQDPWGNKETRLTTQQLKHNLRSLKSYRADDLASTYNVVEGEPNADLMQAYASNQTQSVPPTTEAASLPSQGSGTGQSSVSQASSTSPIESTQPRATHRKPSSTVTPSKNISETPTANYTPTTSSTPKPVKTASEAPGTKSINKVNPSRIILLKNWLCQKWNELTRTIGKALQKLKSWLTTPKQA
jgi:uncharacterized protein YvpB